MSELLHVVGINGSGKSSIAKRVSADYGTPYISASGLLKQTMGVASSAELEQFDQATLDQAYAEAVVRTILANACPTLLDTHSAVFHTDGRVDVTENPELYPYSKAVLDILADPLVIIEWIKADNASGARLRGHSLEVDAVRRRQDISHAAAEQMAKNAGIPHVEILNNDTIEYGAANVYGHIQHLYQS